MDPYGKLLDRMYANLPKRDAGTERFEFPRVESFIQGPKTYVKNFLQLLKIMRREDPRDILKFLTKESASP
ncbi:MAG: translation initiation factor IF-2 subunit beta, partial [archaeon]|nr:translation initiation factor IF-2 subunit beta [archaeon]